MKTGIRANLFGPVVQRYQRIKCPKSLKVQQTMNIDECDEYQRVKFLFSRFTLL
ncbi:hypothetical protein LOAG_06604, partial [Loa loa]